MFRFLDRISRRQTLYPGEVSMAQPHRHPFSSTASPDKTATYGFSSDDAAIVLRGYIPPLPRYFHRSCAAPPIPTTSYAYKLFCTGDCAAKSVAVVGAAAALHSCCSRVAPLLCTSSLSSLAVMMRGVLYHRSIERWERRGWNVSLLCTDRCRRTSCATL